MPPCNLRNPTPRYQILNGCEKVGSDLLMETGDNRARAAAEIFCECLFRSTNTEVVKAMVYYQLVSICDEGGMPRPGLVFCNPRLPLDKVGCAAGHEKVGVQDGQLKGIIHQLHHAHWIRPWIMQKHQFF